MGLGAVGVELDHRARVLVVQDQVQGKWDGDLLGVHVDDVDRECRRLGLGQSRAGAEHEGNEVEDANIGPVTLGVVVGRVIGHVEQMRRETGGVHAIGVPLRVAEAGHADDAVLRLPGLALRHERALALHVTRGDPQLPRDLIGELHGAANARGAVFGRRVGEVGAHEDSLDAGVSRGYGGSGQSTRPTAEYRTSHTICSPGPLASIHPAERYPCPRPRPQRHPPRTRSRDPHSPSPSSASSAPDASS